MGAPLPPDIRHEYEREAWSLRQQCWTQERIAEKFGISQKGVSLMLARVERRMAAKFAKRVERVKARQTAQLENVADQAYQGWLHSKTVMTVEKITTGGGGDDGKGSDTMSVETKTHQCDSSLLGQVRGALADIRGIWGIDAPKKTDMTSGGDALTAPITIVEVMHPMASPAAMYEMQAGGKLRLNFHAGQWQAWESQRRFIAVLAGTQGGKTSYGPWWLWREIQLHGAGDYLAVTSTYDLFKLKMLPALREVFEHVMRCGRYWSGDKIIELADPATGKFLAKRADDPMWGRIILRSAEAGGGLESTTAKGALLDEAGQDAFDIDAWWAILRRLSLNLGRVLIATTLYNFGWLKTEVYDRWAAGDTDYDVVHFDSTENPNFPQAEWERARASMPAWRFDMQYRGRYERPAGLIYDSFSTPLHVIPRFEIPSNWQRDLGLDFGGVNTAGLFYAEEPGTPKLYLYRQYKEGGRTATEHARALKEGEPMIPRCVGGSRSEGQWRAEFRSAGLPVQEPDCREVEVGIARVYGAHKANEILVFDDLAGYLKEKRSYSRKLGKDGQPTEDIENKSSYHFMDAERYIVGWLKRGQIPARSGAFGSRPAPPPVYGQPQRPPGFPGVPGVPQPPGVPGGPRPMPQVPGRPGGPGVPGRHF